MIQKKRLFILFAYWAVMFFAVIYFVAYGDGSAAPFAILASWGGFVVKLISIALDQSDGGLIFVGLLAFLGYYFVLLWFISKLRSHKGSRLFPLPAVVHFGGGIALMLISKRDNFLPPAPYAHRARGEITFFLASYLFSWALTLAWLYIDWRLAGRQPNKSDEPQKELGCR